MIQAAENQHRRLTAESDLRKALLPAKEEPPAEDGTVSYVHYNGQKSPSALESLQLRNDWLDLAVEKCTACDMPAAILEAVRRGYMGVAWQLRGGYMAVPLRPRQCAAPPPRATAM